MQINNRQQNIGFGTLLIKVKDKKDEPFVSNMLRSAKATSGFSKFDDHACSADESEHVYRFEGPEKVEKGIQDTFLGRNAANKEKFRDQTIEVERTKGADAQTKWKSLLDWVYRRDEDVMAAAEYRDMSARRRREQGYLN